MILIAAIRITVVFLAQLKLVFNPRYPEISESTITAHIAYLAGEVDSDICKFAGSLYIDASLFTGSPLFFSLLFPPSKTKHLLDATVVIYCPRTVGYEDFYSYVWPAGQIFFL